MLLNNWFRFINYWRIENLRAPAILLIAVIMFHTANNVYAEDGFCPKTISVQQEITSLPSSWEAFPQALPYQLKSVSFFEGHPKEKVALVNDSSELLNDKNERDTWNFSKSTIGYWIKCNYDQTNIALTKRLSGDISICCVTYDRNITIGGTSLVRDITCR